MVRTGVQFSKKLCAKGPALPKVELGFCPWLLLFKYRTGGPMDEITIKTPNPKCRLYWCLIEFIDWRYSMLVFISTPLFKYFPLASSLLTGSP